MLSALNYFSLATKLTGFLENVCGVSDMKFWKIPPRLRYDRENTTICR